MITTEGRSAKEMLASWDEWLSSPPGKYALKWEQTQFNQAVSDAFGFEALQIGLPQLNCLSENRIPNKYVLITPQDKLSAEEIAKISGQICIGQVNELPFATGSLDLIALPHVLEFAENPHEALREIHRVLRPEGRLVISGFNPMSLWGARQSLGKLFGAPFLPREGQFISHLRIKDWLKLLDYSIDRGRFGCYRLPLKNENGMESMGFLEKAGDRWWPVFGSLFMLSAVKRIPGMRLVGKIQTKKARLRGLVPAANSSAPTSSTSSKQISETNNDHFNDHA